MAFDLKQTLTGAWLRTVAGIRDMGEVIAGYVEDIDGGAFFEVAPDSSDVYVKVRDALEPGRTFLARLFSPGNGWWRLPKKGDAVTVLRPGDADGPGVPVALHGDGGTGNQVPGWDDGTNLDTSNAGFQIPEGFHLESTKDRIRIVANSTAANGGKKSVLELAVDGSGSWTFGAGATLSVDDTGAATLTSAAGTNVNVKAGAGGSVLLNNGALGVARQTDQVTGTAGPYPLSSAVIATGSTTVKSG